MLYYIRQKKIARHTEKMRIYVRLPLSVIVQDLITTGSFYISSDFAILNIVVANRYLTKTSQCLILAFKNRKLSSKVSVL